MRNRSFASFLTALTLLISVAALPLTASATGPLNAEPPSENLEEITLVTAPKITGTIRYKKKLTRTVGTYSENADLSYKTQWLRDGKPISKATAATYTLDVNDVGARISVRVTVSKTGFTPLVATSSQTKSIRHVRDVRTTVKYQIATRGKTTTSKASFSNDVNKILNDPRGWRADGIAFTEVKSGGSMTIYLANAASMTSFSRQCSPTWSCRVGRNVAINQTRWKYSTKTWKAASGTTLTRYRHMVVNHEVGHWLGRGHSTCPGKGKKAPLMMQQSKGLNGCTANPWPLKSELNPPRFR